jgi:hypothetical protein
LNFVIDSSGGIYTYAADYRFENGESFNERLGSVALEQAGEIEANGNVPLLTNGDDTTPSEGSDISENSDTPEECDSPEDRMFRRGYIERNLNLYHFREEGTLNTQMFEQEGLDYLQNSYRKPLRLNCEATYGTCKDFDTETVLKPLPIVVQPFNLEESIVEGTLLEEDDNLKYLAIILTAVAFVFLSVKRLMVYF